MVFEKGLTHQSSAQLPPDSTQGFAEYRMPGGPRRLTVSLGRAENDGKYDPGMGEAIPLESANHHQCLCEGILIDRASFAKERGSLHIVPYPMDKSLLCAIGKVGAGEGWGN